MSCCKKNWKMLLRQLFFWAKLQVPQCIICLRIWFRNVKQKTEKKMFFQELCLQHKTGSKEGVKLIFITNYDTISCFFTYFYHFCEGRILFAAR